ncbi:MAG TPA: hypothetical protein VGQ22_19645, partial [Steroidobacteraceae bacterium]|nr:hypothetical protein [Steroidobacteraceae bacterium]
MSSQTTDESLNDRAQHLLKLLVEHYIRDGQPVGSRTLSRDVGMSLSAATIRNVMADLEELGFVHSPHTSAGRIPTDKGYRFFVDQIITPGGLPAGKKQQVRDFFAHAHGELEQMLHDTSTLLSSLTDCAALVIGPPHERATVRSLQLVDLN